MGSNQYLEYGGGKEHLERDKVISHRRWFYIEKRNTRCVKDLTWWVIDTMERIFLC